jgi:hypothetical protein
MFITVPSVEEKSLLGGRVKSVEVGCWKLVTGEITG